MNQALVQDVVAEVMRRLGSRDGNGSSMPRAVPRAGEDAPANEGKRREADAHPHRGAGETGRFRLYGTGGDCGTAATEAQKTPAKRSLDDRDTIVKLVKRLAKDN